MFQNSMILACGLCLSGAMLFGAVAGCESEPQVRQVSEESSLVSTGLDIQDFQAAATQLTNQMLAAPRVQEQLATIMQANGGKRPYVKISRIRNDTTLKINMVDYFVEPIGEVFTNSGKVDFMSEDQTSSDTAAAQEMLQGRQPRLPDLVLYGTVSRLSTASGDTRQNAYSFRLKLSDTTTGTDFFSGSSQPILKQRRRGGVSL
ncbi:MAG TPA: hypothetical protein VHD56_06905 [Tepidisphaeraceae bacterium]|nr:hypothetical protein [Tepidisphaeraceae bacterium]